MRWRKEVDVILMIVFIIFFFMIGTYVAVKDQKGEKAVDFTAVMNKVEGAKEILPTSKDSPYEEPKEVIEEVPGEIIEENFRIIEIKNTRYDPKEIEIKVGTTVFWTNSDKSRNYQVYEKSSNQKFNSGQIKPFESFNYTFNEPGTYRFNDAVFTFMNGVVIVE
jgi:plastocyanin